MNKPIRPPKPLWEQPVWWGLIAVLIMVGGWQLSAWRPVQNAQIEEIRGMSEDPELNRRLDRLAPVSPFELPGRLVTFAGIGLFLFAIVRMYRAPRGLPRDEMPEPDSELSSTSLEEHA